MAEHSTAAWLATDRHLTNGADAGVAVLGLPWGSRFTEAVPCFLCATPRGPLLPVGHVFDALP